MVIGLDILIGSARTFYEIYRLCEQRKTNDAAITLLKERIETLVASVESLAQSSDVIETAFQAMQELVRRLQAAVSSARMIIERYAESGVVKRTFFSGGHRDRLMNVSNELNGCAADLNLLMTLRVYADAESQEERVIREERLYTEMAAMNERFIRALEQDASKYDSISRAISNADSTNQQLHADSLRQMREVGDGIHIRLNDMERQLQKRMKAFSVTQIKSIDKVQVKDYVTLFEGRHIIQRCEFNDGDISLPCIFKYINPGNQRIIGFREVSVASTEMAVLNMLKVHPYFPKIIGRFERDPNSVGLLMEYIGDGEKPVTLREYLVNNMVEWSERLRFMRQLVSAVAFMHKQGIIHCGINSNDILVRKDPEYGSYIKLIDFDRAFILGADTVNPIADSDSREDEHPYFAPELFQNSHPSFSTDIFAVGTILWELAYCSVPFEHIPPASVQSLILSGEREGLPSGRMESAPSELTEVIRMCWSKDPALRPTATRLDEATFDVYRCDVATARKIKSGSVGEPGVPVSIKDWREEYLRIRSGLSSEDLVCVRVISSFWSDPRLPPSYLPSDPHSRQHNAYKWLQYAVDNFEYGGAAYEIAKHYFGGIKSPDGREWLTKAKNYGHPMSTLELARYKYKEEGSLSREDYQKTGREMETLSKLRDKLSEQRQIQRRGITTF
ncbi:hypothetical protein HDU67_000817 [Dinochytrium kinnereticum]|nr:hypothetical protein HDU67_000817 [Dinochytrium kinnereticum]